MTKVKFDKSLNRFEFLFADGGSGWMSRRAVEDNFPDRNWNVVQENANKWFYL